MRILSLEVQEAGKLRKLKGAEEVRRSLVFLIVNAKNKPLS